VAVVEIGRRLAVGRAARERVAAAVARVGAEPLRDRISQADLIVLGKVVAMKRVETTKEFAFGEHHPDWWNASIDVDSVLKGRLRRRALTFFFPSSVDVKWLKVPKPRPGQAGIWILKRTRIREIETVGFTALDPLDVRVRDDVEVMRVSDNLEGLP
jgi:hypothetical protein